LAYGIELLWISRRGAGTKIMASIVPLLPLLVLPLERLLPLVTSVETVSNTIEIDAPPGRVWGHVVRVREIQPDERVWLLAYAAGVPKPVRAELDHDGLGGLRRGIFDNGLTFHEVITLWEPERHVAFTIEPYAPSVYAPFDNIGRTYLGLVDAEYTLTELGQGRMRLELSSRHRVTTRYNAYSTLLTRHMMSEFQADLLRIIKARAEAS
jgi:hypothetical protein